MIVPAERLIRELAGGSSPGVGDIIEYTEKGWRFRSATSHESDLSIDWNQLINVPSTFPPSAHSSSHETGGGDEILLDNLSGTLLKGQQHPQTAYYDAATAAFLGALSLNGDLTFIAENQRVVFSGTGGNQDNPPWREFSKDTSGDPNDQVFYTTYNYYRSGVSTVDRDDASKPSIRYGMEPDWFGVFEWNLDVYDPNEAFSDGKRLLLMSHVWGSENTDWFFRGRLNVRNHYGQADPLVVRRAIDQDVASGGTGRIQSWRSHDASAILAYVSVDGSIVTEADVVVKGKLSGSTAGGQVKLGGSGSQGAPMLAFSAEPNMGWYRIASGRMGFSVGGVQRIAMNNSAIWSSQVGGMDLGLSAANPWGTLYVQDAVLTSLPTSDPLVAGALWDDAGTVKISAG